MYIAIVTPSGENNYDMGLVARQLRNVLFGSIFLIRGSELVILINLDKRLVPNYDERYSDKYLHNLVVEEALLKQAVLNNLTIGISHMFYDLTHIREHYVQAKKIVSIRTRIYDWDVTYFSTAAPAEVLHIVYENDNLLMYCEPELHDLIRIDEQENSELVKTLFCYLEAFGSASRAASLLHIHKNTLHYRLDKIKQIIGRDIKDGETVYRLMMSFRILTALRIIEPPIGFNIFPMMPPNIQANQ